MSSTTAIWRALAQAGLTPAESYERYFVPCIARPFAENLVASAALRPGERVLDVACGTGVVARLAAQHVGAGGEVAGLDVDPGMLAVARATAAAEGATIRWYETGADSIPLPDNAFDAVLCQLSFQFMADKVAALREMRRVLAPGGRLLVSVPPSAPLFEAFDEALGKHAGEDAAGFVRAVFSLHDPDRVRELFREAGFDDVAVKLEKKTLRLPPAREFLWQYVHSTPLVGPMEKLREGRKEALEHDLEKRWQPWARNGSITYEQPMIVATGRRE
jgi:ubiquinone/menaquinone biosynthesis C-methylase UbiE